MKPIDYRNAPPNEIATAKAYLSLLQPVTGKPTHNWPGSYGLKHQAERWGRCNEMAPYVSQDALLVAALEMNYPISEFRDVGVRRRDVDRLAKLIDAQLDVCRGSYKNQ